MAMTICSPMARCGSSTPPIMTMVSRATEQLPGGVGVHGRHGAGVTGVHGLEHVERLRTTALSDDDEIRPRSQRVAHEVPDADLTRPPLRWPGGSPG